MYVTGVAPNDMTFKPNFVKICQLLQTLTRTQKTAWWPHNLRILRKELLGKNLAAFDVNPVQMNQTLSQAFRESSLLGMFLGYVTVILKLRGYVGSKEMVRGAE